MINKSIYLYLMLIVVLLITTPIGASATNFPNLSTSVTHSYSLDISGNIELYTVYRIENIDSDFFWTTNKCIGIPIRVASYSEERPKVTMVTIEDFDTPYSITDYQTITRPDGMVIHGYNVEVFPPKNAHFQKNAMQAVPKPPKIHIFSHLHIIFHTRFDF